MDNDRFFLKQLANNKLSVSINGIVTNNVTRKQIGSFNGKFKRVGMKDFDSDIIRVIQAHRLLWLAYHGEIPKKYTIRFKDDNKKNICLDNLELLSYSENLRLKKLGGKNPKARFSDENVLQFRVDYKNKKINKEYIMTANKASRQAVESMLRKESYSHI